MACNTRHASHMDNMQARYVSTCAALRSTSLAFGGHAARGAPCRHVPTQNECDTNRAVTNAACHLCNRRPEVQARRCVRRGCLRRRKHPQPGSCARRAGSCSFTVQSVQPPTVCCLPYPFESRRPYPALPLPLPCPTLPFPTIPPLTHVYQTVQPTISTNRPPPRSCSRPRRSLRRSAGASCGWTTSR